MSSSAVISRNEAYPVTVGYCTLFCDRFRASAVKVINEETTVNSGSIFTSSGLRALRLELSGRIYNENSPLDLLFRLSNEIQGQTFTIEYKGLIFSDCVMQKYEVTDSGKGWTEGSFTLLTHSAVREVAP